MSFDHAFARTIGHEGGYVNDPRDRGGETKYGISARAYPGVNIAALTLDDAKAIYHRDYWLRCRCDLMPPATAAAVFDLAVNAGPVAAIRDLQLALAEISDGVIGAATLAAIKSLHGDRLADTITAVRVHAAGLERRTSAPTWPVHGKGWTRRVVKNLLEMNL